MATSQHMSNINLLSDDDEDDSFTDDETAPLGDFNSTRGEELKPWDLFRNMPMEDLSGSLAQKKAVDAFSKIAKTLAYILTFIVLLSAAVISKGTLLFMTSQIRMSDTTDDGIQNATPNVTHEYCSTRAGRAIEASISTVERIGWMWTILFCFLVPEFFTWFRSMRICFFRAYKAPKLIHFLIVMFFDTLHVAGMAMFVYLVLPNLKVVEGLMLTNCFCVVPGLLNMLSRTTKTSHRYLKLALDLLAILAQLSGLFLWAALNWVTSNSNLMWLLPVSLFLTSFGWWENYVDKESPVGFVKYLNGIKESLKSTRYFTYAFVSIWRGFVFFASLLIIEWTLVGDVNHLFEFFYPAFEEHPYNVTEIRTPGQSTGLNSLTSTSEKVVLSTDTAISWPYVAAYVLAIHASLSLLCFLAGKFACKIRIQSIGFALPINLAVPVTMTILITFCGLRMGNACMFSDIIPPYLFFECPTGDFLSELLSNQHAWAWAFWLLSQGWITAHNWMPKAGRLAKTEQLFINPYYSTFLVEQSMAMNRRREDEDDIKTEEINLDREDLNDIQLNQAYYGSSMTSSSGSSSSHSGPVEETDVNPADSITRIFICATMWHENDEETVTFLKSIFYLDEDQSARRVAQKYLRVVDPDYYEIETHIYFDDAFELSDDDDDEMVVNGFVRMLIDCMDKAASQVHQVNIKIRPPKKYPTPYGGRLVWTLPGKTKIIAHLKDKQKIRNRKRWSQVMYMYYILGHKLMELPISVHRKATIAQNTYLLALDGDIDFMPNAVHLLIDLMKRNANLAAACGRIHPVGSGLMAWYQSFEYAIGHWLQKATEHMLGCVLCSPGCFSLFRGRALMEDNVMAKYTTKATEARHYVQYDQGEDRWLCTLLLQRGFRVEYCAASDSYTHCPEGFDEFYNQRRRWVPSTMANILDLLMDYKRTISVNDNISLPYIFYQAMLMVGTILGPGTIFLMIVGSFNVALGMDNWTAFLVNLIPIIGYMLICMTCKAKFQVQIAQIMSAIYAIVMMMVLVGIILQLSEDGWSSPSSMFLLLTAFTFIFAACLHPQEFWCLPTGLVYYLTVPSMYLLLIIYSVCNLNNVSWGTREVPQKKKKADAAADQQAAAAAAAANNKKKGSNGISNMFGLFTESKDDQDEGSIEFSLAGLFKIMCCVHRKPDNGEAKQLLAIAESLNALNKRLDSIEKYVNPQSFNSRKSVSASRRGSVSTVSGIPAHHQMNVDLNLSNIDEDVEQSYYDSDDMTNDSEIVEKKEERDNLSNPYWLEDKAMTRGVVDFLTGNEIQFWKDLIEKYLYPLDEEQPEKKKKIMAELKELRDKTVFTFFIINALYVTVVFLLTLEKDTVYIRWPLGIEYNMTYVYYDSPLLPTVQVGKTYLKLEPIGLVFVIFFASIMIIQFIAMLFHRFGTLSQILASTDLNFCARNMDDMSDEAFLQKNAVEIAKNLQSLKGVDEHDKDDGRNDKITRRNTVYNLERSKSQRAQPKTLDLTAAFRKRIDSIAPDGTNSNDPLRAKKSILVRRGTMKQLAKANSNDRRRSTILAEVRRRSSMGIEAEKSRRSTIRRDHNNDNNIDRDTDYSGSE